MGATQPSREFRPDVRGGENLMVFSTPNLPPLLSQGGDSLPALLLATREAFSSDIYGVLKQMVTRA